MPINERKIDTAERSRLIELAHKLGCTVYQRDPSEDTWFYYTDGKNIAYAQFSCREPSSLTTCHKPSRQVGTGFAFDTPYGIDGKAMQAALLCIAPHWATDSDRANVVKWKDWNEYKASSPWNAEYQEVTE